MYQKTNTTKNNNKRKINNRTIKNKHGGQEYKHRRVGLFCKQIDTEYPISCNVCNNNDYIERPSTLGKTKENQAFFNLFFGETILEDYNNISIITYVCRICSMCKIVRDDKNNYIYKRDLI
jgi:hypothetical protein